MSKIFIQVDSTTKRVVFMHYKYDILSDTDKAMLGAGIFVDSVPEIQEQPYKVAHLCYDATSGFYTEYEDRPLTEEEKNTQKISELETYNANLEYTLMMAGVI